MGGSDRVGDTRLDLPGRRTCKPTALKSTASGDMAPDVALKPLANPRPDAYDGMDSGCTTEITGRISAPASSDNDYLETAHGCNCHRDRENTSHPVQPFHLAWALRNSSGVGEGIHHSVIQGGGEFSYIGVAG